MRIVTIILVLTHINLLTGCSDLMKPKPVDIVKPLSVSRVIAAYERGEICQPRYGGYGKKTRIRTPIYAYADGTHDPGNDDTFTSSNLRHWIGTELTTETEANAKTLVIVNKQEVETVDAGKYQGDWGIADASGDRGYFQFCIVQLDEALHFYAHLGVPYNVTTTGRMGATRVHAKMQGPRFLVRDLFWEEIGVLGFDEKKYVTRVWYRCIPRPSTPPAAGEDVYRTYTSTKSCSDVIAQAQEDIDGPDICTEQYPNLRTWRIEVQNPDRITPDMVLCR